MRFYERAIRIFIEKIIDRNGALSIYDAIEDPECGGISVFWTLFNHWYYYSFFATLKFVESMLLYGACGGNHQSKGVFWEKHMIIVPHLDKLHISKIVQEMIGTKEIRSAFELFGPGVHHIATSKEKQRYSWVKGEIGITVLDPIEDPVKAIVRVRINSGKNSAVVTFSTYQWLVEEATKKFETSRDSSQAYFWCYNTVVIPRLDEENIQYGVEDIIRSGVYSQAFTLGNEADSSFG